MPELAERLAQLVKGSTAVAADVRSYFRSGKRVEKRVLTPEERDYFEARKAWQEHSNKKNFMLSGTPRPRR